MAAVSYNYDLYTSEIIEGKKTALLDFWAPWCTYCKRIGPAYEKIAEQYGDRLIVGKVNIDEETRLPQELTIEVIPTLVLFKEGKPVASLVAPESKAKIDAFLQENL